MSRFAKLTIALVLLIVGSTSITTQGVYASNSYMAKTVTAYASFGMDWGMGSYPVMPEGTIQLQAVTGSQLYKGTVIPYDQTIKIKDAAVAKGFKFYNVPANSQPMLLTIKITNPGSGQVAIYSATYKFTCTKKSCGNMGKFTYNLVTNTIVNK